MNNLPRFVKIGENRINIDEIILYGIDFEYFEDDEAVRYLYVVIRDDEDIIQYYEDDDLDFDIDEKVAELDELFLIK